jgi:hypothetical protein
LRHAAVAATLLLLASCGGEQVAPSVPVPVAAQPAVADAEPRNLASMIRGGAIVSRTGEMMLEQTPVRLIDGDVSSHWTTPPADLQQSCVISLAAPARLTGFGLGTFEKQNLAVKRVRIETSLDGRTFTPAASMSLTASDAIQDQKVTPVDARYIRLSIDEGYGTGYAALSALQAYGSFLTEPGLADIAGCWEINGAQASIQRSGNAVSGWIEWEGMLHLSGGAATGPFYRFAWADGPQFGLAAITLTPDGKHMSGMKWHERAEPLTFGTSWFGTKGTECNALGSDPDAVARLWLQRTSTFPLYGLQFDARDQLVADGSEATLALISRIVAASRGVSLVASELREKTPAANRAKTDVRIRSLRDALSRRGIDTSKISWVSAGSDTPAPRMASELTLDMTSAVVIRVAGSSF